MLAPWAPLAKADPEAEPEPVRTTSQTKGTGASWRASEIVGSEVQNAEGETIGKIEDLIVDFKSQKLLAAVVSTGGFLGVADTLTAVPGTALRYDTTAKAFKTKLTKEQLGKAPSHKTGTWEENKETLGEKLQAYQVSLGGDKDAPDNSARNAEVVKDKEPTPMDQGNSDADIKTTKDIRSAVVASDQLSFNAKNIKIITRDGKVTLKGVVADEAEHQKILELSNAYVKADALSDQIEIKK